jgi:hypothetical protein
MRSQSHAQTDLTRAWQFSATTMPSQSHPEWLSGPCLTEIPFRSKRTQ